MENLLADMKALAGTEQDRSIDGERHLGTNDGKADERKLAELKM